MYTNIYFFLCILLTFFFFFFPFGVFPSPRACGTYPRADYEWGLGEADFLSSMDYKNMHASPCLSPIVLKKESVEKWYRNAVPAYPRPQNLSAD